MSEANSKSGGGEKADSASENAIFYARCTLIRKYSILKHSTSRKAKYTYL